jgi:hypothetical protein
MHGRIGTEYSNLVKTLQGKAKKMDDTGVKWKTILEQEAIN